MATISFLKTKNNPKIALISLVALGATALAVALSRRQFRDAVKKEAANLATKLEVAMASLRRQVGGGSTEKLQRHINKHLQDLERLRHDVTLFL